MNITTTIQTYLFSRKYWTVLQVMDWLRGHNLEPDIDCKPGFYRARQHNPGKFIKSSLRTIVLSDTKGIKATVGHLK